ncbi:MAG: VUT family protein [Deltaproteobacteria bacterium]|nr:VUT family protein [Deltaproteobacteria bacterium]
MMENRRPEFALILLCSLFLVVVVLSYILQGKVATLTEMPIAVLEVDNSRYPLHIGVIPFSVFLLALALICLDLVNEFYGQRDAFFLSLSGGIAVLFVWALLKGLTYVPTDLGQAAFDRAYAVLFNLDPRFSLVFELFRQLTHSGFIIIRLFMAHLLGLAVFSAVGAALENESPLILGEALQLALTRYVQWFLVSFLLIPIFYVLMIPFRILVGRAHYATVKVRFAKKKVFRYDNQDNFFEGRSEMQEKRIPTGSGGPLEEHGEPAPKGPLVGVEP